METLVGRDDVHETIGKTVLQDVLPPLGRFHVTFQGFHYFISLLFQGVTLLDELLIHIILLVKCLVGICP